MTATFHQENLDPVSSSASSLGAGAGESRVRIFAKITPQRGQVTGPGSNWPQRGQTPLPGVSALVVVVVVFVKVKMVTARIVA
jgi:hypothetical protein